MRDFVPHHTRQFGLFVGAQNQAAVHIEKAAGQSKRVNFIRVDHLDGEGTLASELRTRFCPTRFTYSVTTGSLINLAVFSTSMAACFPRAISRCREYKLTPLPTPRLPMELTSFSEPGLTPFMIWSSSEVVVWSCVCGCGVESVEAGCC